ncbi:MAG: outer membrane protein assembly factor BamA [Elusimicrobiota bacterium]|jgi:outer membrane protein insertion porin family
MRHPYWILFLFSILCLGPLEKRVHSQEQTSSSSTAALSLSSAAAETSIAEASSSSEPVLAQIQLSGVSPEQEKDVLSLMSAKELSPYSDAQQERDRQTLLASGRFASVHLTRVPLSGTHFRLDVDLQPGTPAPAPSAHDDVPKAPWVIGELALSGNKRIKLSVVRAQIKARPGDLYERYDLDKDIQAVLALGQFERVAADITAMPSKPVPANLSSVAGSSTAVKLTFIVEERNLVKRIRFEGNKGLSKARLLDEMTLKNKDPFDRAKLRTDEDKLLEYYHKKGYLRAVVRSTWTEEPSSHNLEVSFLIQEGPKSRIQEVRIQGVQAFKIKKVLKKMENRRKKIFDEKKLPEDLKKIETLYKNEGYLDFETLSSSVSFSEDGSRIFINIQLKEGRQYRYGDTTFSGNMVYKSSSLVTALDYRKGKLFSQERFDYTLRNIQEMYAEMGRLRTRVEPVKTFNSTTSLMDVRFDITEGNVVYIDHIDIEGNKTTKTYVFRRELTIHEGQPFSVSKVRKSQEKIMNLGFIDDVSMDIQSPLDPDKADLIFEIAEGKPGMLTAGAGFSSLDGLVGQLSLQHMNLFGRAQRASVQWSFGSRVQDYSLSWTSPWIADHPTSLGFDLFNTRRISPFDNSSSAYMSRRVGGGIRVGPRFQDDKYQLNFNYTFQKISVTNVQTQFLDRLSEGTSIQSSFGAEIARDTRDNIWDPTKGTRNGLGAVLTGGPLMGDIHFLKPSLFNSIHYTLFKINDWPFVFSLSNRAGYITQFGPTKEVPVFERYFIGGQDSLRGYSYAGEAGWPGGGKVYDVCNIEVGFPLARERRKTIVKFITFFDAGGSWDNMYSTRLHVGPDSSDIKTDVGFGIRFVTPAFPIRLDWGYGLNHRPGEQRYQVNFGIGPMF